MKIDKISLCEPGGKEAQAIGHGTRKSSGSAKHVLGGGHNLQLALSENLLQVISGFLRDVLRPDVLHEGTLFKQHLVLPSTPAKPPRAGAGFPCPIPGLSSLYGQLCF